MEQDLLDKNAPPYSTHIITSIFLRLALASTQILIYSSARFHGEFKGQFLFKLGKPQQWLGHLKATKIRVDEVLLQEFSFII